MASRSRRMLMLVILAVWGLWGAVFAPLTFSSPEQEAGTGNVTVIPVEGSIDPGTFSFIERSLEEAQKRDATVIVELNTPGGYMDTALDTGNSLQDYPGKVIAWVNRDAFSAGAYLALCADEIYMSSGSGMGSATPVHIGGGAADEKTVSAWEGKMRSVAGDNERDKQIASAMVREEVTVDGLVESGELLTLAPDEALEVGYSEGTVASKEELLEKAGLENARVDTREEAPVDTFIGWITNPYVGTVLIALGIGGLILEVATAGFGAGGLVGLLSLGMYFGSSIMGGLAGYEVLVLFAGGVLLMLVEALMPGFGIFGGGGLLMTFVSIVLAAASTGQGITMLFVALLLAGVILFFILRFLARRGVLRKFILVDSEKKESGYVAPKEQEHLLGKEGRTLTPLRPAGSVLIDDRRIDVVSEGDFIDKDAEVVVVEVEGARVVVRKK